MSISSIVQRHKTQLMHLPAYAGFLLEHCLDDFAKKQLEFYFELEVPLTKHFSFMTERELLNLFRLRSIEMLSLLSEQKNEAHIRQSIKHWDSDLHGTENAYSEIASLGFIQKQTFLNFITHYSEDPRDIISVVTEIDQHMLKLQSTAFRHFSAGTENQVTEQAPFLKKIAKLVPSMVFAFDLIGHRLLYINDKVTELLGYNKEILYQMSGDIAVQLIHPDDLASLSEKTNHFYETSVDDIKIIEARIKDIHGIYHPVESHITICERTDAGKPAILIGALVDITRLRETESALKQKTFQLEQSNTSLEEFAYIASHDLKEPLRKISAFGDRLLERHRDNLNEEGKIYLDKMLASSGRMQGMIGDLLSISRISANKTFEQCDLNHLLREVIKILEVKIERKKAIIQSDPLPSLRVIPAQVQQLFLNILNNSLKFARSGVPPEVKITHKYVTLQETAQLNLCPSRKYLRIEFADNGIGFDNQFSERIFTIFQRLHGKNEYEGSGIGLTICKKIMDNHEGMIRAAGSPGEGSIFTIIFPV